MSINWGGAYILKKARTAPEEKEEPERAQWHVRFAPSAPDSLIGNPGPRAIVRQWFEAAAVDLRRDAPVGGGALMVHGARGTGKTSCVRACAAAAGLRIVGMDMDESKGAVAVQGLLRKSLSEGAVLLVDDAHRLIEGCTGLQLLLKTLKAMPGNPRLKVVCCLDAVPPSGQRCRLSALINAGAAMAEFEPVRTEELAAHLPKIVRRAGARLGYFDAMAIAGAAAGDVRQALVRAEYLFVSRPPPPAAAPCAAGLKRKAAAAAAEESTDNLLLVRHAGGAGAAGVAHLPDSFAAASAMVHGEGEVARGAAEAAAYDGVRYARSVVNAVHRRWLLHCPDDIDLKTLSAGADALSQCDLELRVGLVDEEASEDLRESELVEYEFRPEACMALLAGALRTTGQRQEMVRQAPRLKRRKFDFSFQSSRDLGSPPGKEAEFISTNLARDAIVSCARPGSEGVTSGSVVSGSSTSQA